MNLVPEMVLRAMPGTKTEGKLTLAEAAGIKAIHAEIRKIKHERLELAMKDQKLGVLEEETIEALEQAWRELAVQHGFDVNVPVTSWQISKKNRAMLDVACHPTATYDTPGDGHGDERRGDRAPGTGDGVDDGVPAGGDDAPA